MGDREGGRERRNGDESRRRDRILRPKAARPRRAFPGLAEATIDRAKPSSGSADQDLHRTEENARRCTCRCEDGRNDRIDRISPCQK